MPPMKSSLFFVFSILAFLECCSVVVAQSYSTEHQCLQSESALVILSKDPVSGNFSVVQRLDSREPVFLPGIQFRKLELSQMTEHEDERRSLLRTEVAAFPAIVAEGAENTDLFRRLHDFGGQVSREEVPAVDSDELYYAWECSCHSDAFQQFAIAYCPLDIDTCLRPSRWRTSNRIPGCRNIAKAYDVSRYTFFFAMIWLLVLLVALWTSGMGSSMGGFLMSRCVPDWNDRAVNRLLRRHPDRARQMIRTFVVREQRALLAARTMQATNTGDEGQAGTMNGGGGSDVNSSTTRLTSLVLRTKVYRTSSQPDGDKDDSASETEEDRCIICFSSFTSGDRVGSLKCSHLFHSDCLKVWLQRRNACPLCQTEDIAMPRHEETLSATEESSSTRVEDDGTIDHSVSDDPPSA